MITRTNPEVGYLAEEVFKKFAFTQSIRVGNTLYLSGVAPLRGGLKDLEVMGAGDLRAQVEWVLEVIRRSLASEGATFRNWVAQTVYVTDIAGLARIADVFPLFSASTLPPAPGSRSRHCFTRSRWLRSTASPYSTEPMSMTGHLRAPST